MGPDTACQVYVAAASLITDRRNMPASQSESDSDFGAAFTALMDAAGFSPDRLVARLAPGLVSRSTLYDWRKGQHLPEDTRSLLEATALCLLAARDRKAALTGMPRDEDGWLRLLAAAKQARDSRGAQHRRSPDRRPHPVLPGKLIGEWDPASLGVHRAVGGRPLPGYVRRHHDDLLNSALHPQAHGSRLVVLRGGSSTGKSRAAYQAVKECLPSWRVDYPRTPAALEQRLRDGVAPHSVIWLGELRDYVERADGPVALDLLADLLDSDRQIVVITTLWHEHWAAYTDSRANKPGAPHPGSAIQAVLTALPELRVQGETPSRGAVIDVPDRFTQSEVTLALQQKDPVLRDAVTAAAAAGAKGEITQYLAGVPDLLKQYEGAGRDPYGQAILSAAVDAARLGHPGPYTPKLLREAVSGYLTDRQRTADISGWWDNAMAYCTEELNGAVRALEPVPPAQGTGIAGYRLADYLEQHGRHSRQGHRCPVTLWDSLIANTTAPGHLTRLAWAAYSRGLYRLASLLSRRAISLGEDNPGAFVLLLPKLGPDDARRASLWVADRIAVKDPRAVASLLNGFREGGYTEAVTSLLERHPADHVMLNQPRDALLLIDALHNAGAIEQAAQLAAATAGRLTGRDLLGYPSLLEEFSQIASEDIAAVTAIRIARQCDLSSFFDVAKLLQVLREQPEAATELAERAAMHAAIDNPLGTAWLLDALRQAGAGSAVTALLARAPADQANLHGALSPYGPWGSLGIAKLLGALRRADAEEAATALASRLANQVALEEPSVSESLLRAFWRVGEEVTALLAPHIARRVRTDEPRSTTWLLDSFRATGAVAESVELARRAAGNVALRDPEAIAGLLGQLRQTGAQEAITALLDRHPADHVELRNPAGIAALLSELRRTEAPEAAAALLDRHPADHVELNDLGGIAALLSEFHLAQGDGTTSTAQLPQAVTGLLLRCAENKPDSLTSLLGMLHQAGANRAVIGATAMQAAEHIQLHTPRHLTALLDELHETGAKEAASALLARGQAHSITYYEHGSVAHMLTALRQAGADGDVVNAAAVRAAERTPLDNPERVARLLDDLREAGATEAISVLLGRRPADHIAHYDDMYIVRLLHALRRAGGWAAAATLAARAANEGLYHAALTFQHPEDQDFPFGREPDNTASLPWTWED